MITDAKVLLASYCVDHSTKVALVSCSGVEGQEHLVGGAFSTAPILSVFFFFFGLRLFTGLDYYQWRRSYKFASLTDALPELLADFLRPGAW
jgi:hypothetical protein